MFGYEQWLYLAKFDLSLFNSQILAPAIAPLLEHLFSPLASKNGFCSWFWLTAGVALTRKKKWRVDGQIIDNLKPPYLKPPSLIIGASIFDNWSLRL